MGPMMQPIAGSYQFSNFIVNLVARDMKDADAVARTRGGKGACIAWVLGHLMYYRYQMMQLLGAETENPYAVYARGAGDVPQYPTMATLLQQWNETGAALDKVFAATQDAVLTKPPTGAPHGEKHVLDTAVFFMWHESYHLGQLGTIRTELGYRGVAELAIEAKRSD